MLQKNKMEEEKKVKRESDRKPRLNKSEWMDIHWMESAPVLCQSLFPHWCVSTYHWDLRQFRTNLISTRTVSNKMRVLRQGKFIYIAQFRHKATQGAYKLH